MLKFIALSFFVLMLVQFETAEGALPQEIAQAHARIEDYTNRFFAALNQFFGEVKSGYQQRAHSIWHGTLDEVAKIREMIDLIEEMEGALANQQQPPAPEPAPEPDNNNEDDDENE